MLYITAANTIIHIRQQRTKQQHYQQQGDTAKYALQKRSELTRLANHNACITEH